MITQQQLFQQELHDLAYCMDMAPEDLNVLYIVSANMEDFTLVSEEALLAEAIADDFDKGIYVYNVTTGAMLSVEL